MIRPILVSWLAALGLGAPALGQAKPSLSPRRWGRGEEIRYLDLLDSVRTRAGVATGLRGAVAVAYGGYAARAGLEALKQGGTAADAALTTALTQVAITAGAPVSYFGILSLVYYDAKTGETSTMNAAWNTVKGEVEPLTIPGKIDLAGQALGTDVSGRTALVGGFMKGIEAAHRRFGRLPFASLFEPAIRIAEGGMPVTKVLAGQLALRAADLGRLPATRAIYLKGNGEPYRAGERFYQKALAATLRQVGRHGADYMYRGPWADRLVAAVQADGGKLTKEDLASYQVLWAPPIRGRVGSYQIATVPNQGGVALIEAQNLAVASGLTRDPHWAQSAHSLRKAADATQAMMLGLLPAAYARQLYPDLDLSDSARVTPEHAERVWREFSRGNLPVKWGEQGPKHSDDVVVIDGEGNMAAITHSINCVYWGKTAINVDGISIGDPGSFQQAAIAAAGPGNRLPDPTETGLLFQDGFPVLAFASMGAGLHQRTFQGLLNYAVFGMSVDQAIDAPDFFLPSMRPAAKGFVLMVPEGRFPKQVLEGTGLRYEEVASESARLGGEGVWVAISRDPKTGALRAGSHNRSNSAAVAY